MVLELSEKHKKERRIGNAQVAKRFLASDVEIVEEKAAATKETSNVKSQPTVGSTTISSNERQWIRDEVRNIIDQSFPGIQMQTGNNPNMKIAKSISTVVEQTMSGNQRNQTEVINLCSNSQGPSASQAIAGSDVSVASTSNNGGNAADFLRLSQ